jgi:N utilization substance protein B
VSRHHRARRLALQGLCCLDAQGARVLDLVDQFVADSDEDPAVLTEAGRMLHEAAGDLPQCDAFLTRHARNWDLSRLALVDRNILRLAVRELLVGQTPFKVVISEALKLAQEFSTAESPRFINGVLDAVVKELQATARGPEDQQERTG